MYVCVYVHLCMFACLYVLFVLLFSFDSAGVSGSTLLVAARSKWQGSAVFGAGTLLGLWRSTDSGQTWSQPSGVITTDAIYSMERDPNDDTFIAAVGTSGTPHHRPHRSASSCHPSDARFSY